MSVSVPPTEVGSKYEKIAETHLLSLGLRIVARNYRVRCGEWDLIAEEVTERGGLELVLVEVRARTQKARWQEGFETVGFRKRTRLERAARCFLLSYSGAAESIRFDVIACDGVRVIHLRDAWKPGV